MEEFLVKKTSKHKTPKNCPHLTTKYKKTPSPKEVRVHTLIPSKTHIHTPPIHSPKKLMSIFNYLYINSRVWTFLEL